MHIRLLPVLLFLGAALFAGRIHAAEGLDQKAVHGEYENGDFESVLRMIDRYQKRNPRYSPEDSLFIAKHLAVVYAANPKSVEVGKYWMHRMLALMPSADLGGMYVNEDIDRIFDKVRREFMALQAAAGVDMSPLTAHSPAGDVSAKGGKPGSSLGGGRKVWIWVGASGAALAAVLTYFALSEASSSQAEPSPVLVEL